MPWCIVVDGRLCVAVLILRGYGRILCNDYRYILQSEPDLAGVEYYVRAYGQESADLSCLRRRFSKNRRNFEELFVENKTRKFHILKIAI